MNNDRTANMLGALALGLADQIRAASERQATEGGPAQATNILVYKVYFDGFVGQNMGSSAAQSVILMLIVIALTVVQFRYVEKKVAY